LPSTLSDETGTPGFDDADGGGADLLIFLFFDGTVSRFSCGCVGASPNITSDFAVIVASFLAFSLAFCFARLAWRAANFAF